MKKIRNERIQKWAAASGRFATLTLALLLTACDSPKKNEAKIVKGNTQKTLQELVEAWEDAYREYGPLACGKILALGWFVNQAYRGAPPAGPIIYPGS